MHVRAELRFTALLSYSVTTPETLKTLLNGVAFWPIWGREIQPRAQVTYVKK